MYAYSSGYGRDGERLANFPGNPFYDDHSRRRRQIHYLEHTLMSTGGSLDEVIGAWALTTRPSDSPRGGCRTKSHHELPPCGAPGLPGLPRPTSKRV